MGQQNSVAINHVEDIKNLISETIISNLSECSASSAVNQTFGADFVGGNVNLNAVKLDSQVTISLDCVHETINESKMKNDIETQLKQQAEAKTEGFEFLNFKNSNTNNTAKAILNIKNAVNISNIKKSIVNSITNQSIKFTVVVGDFNAVGTTIESVKNIVLESISKDTNVMESVNELATIYDQSATSTAIGLGGAGSIISCILSMCIVLSLLAIGAYFYMKKSPQGQAAEMASKIK